jgi:hypothetical protein
MLTELCAEIRNYFVRDVDSDIIRGQFTISGNVITPLSSALDGQYIRIVGSVFNDGVWKYSPDGIEGLVDEEFDGAVWLMSVPPAVIDLSNEIDVWIAANKDVTNSPYQSESFGGYTYSLKSGGGSSSGGSNGATWQNIFSDRLKPYRRLVILP